MMKGSGKMKKHLTACLLSFSIVVSLLSSQFSILGDNDSIKGNSVKHYEEGINGALTAEGGFRNLNSDKPPYEDGDTLVLPYASGIYLIKDGAVTLDIKLDGAVTSFTVIQDIDNDGIREIAAVIADSEFSKLRVLSGRTGEMLWQFDYYESVLSDYTYTEEKNRLPIFSVTSIEDQIIDNSFVAVISNYSIVALSAKNGKVMWEHKSKDNVWNVANAGDINGNGHTDLAAGNQLGEVFTLDGKDGKVIWSVKLADPIDIYDLRGKKSGYANRNVWSIISEASSLLASCEDGNIYYINKNDGRIEKKIEIYEMNAEELYNFYVGEQGSYADGTDSNADRTIGLTKKGFMGLELIPVSDVTGDGKTDYIVTQFMNSTSRFSSYLLRAGGNYGTNDPDIDQKVGLIDGEKEELVWLADSFMDWTGMFYSKPFIKDTDDSKSIIFPDGDNGKIKFIAYKALDGSSFESGSIDISYYNKGEADYSSETAPSYISDIDNNGNVFVGAIDKFSYIVNSDLKSIKASFNDYSSGSLLKGIKDRYIGLFSNSGGINRITGYENDLSGEKWSFACDNDADCFADVIAGFDYNEDNIIDIITLQKVNSGKYIISVYDTETGNMLVSKEIVFNNAAKLYITDDLNGDGINEIMVIGDQTSIFDGKTLNTVYDVQLKSFSLIKEGANENTEIIGDVNDDGIPDFLLLERDGAERLISSIKSSGGVNQLIFERDGNKFSYNVYAENQMRYRMFDDINNDGFPEFAFVTGNTSESVPIEIMSSKTMEPIYKLDDYFNCEYYFSNNDYNGDGISDYVVKNMFTRGISVISGKDDSTLITIGGSTDNYYYGGQYYGMAQDAMYNFNAVQGDYLASVGDLNNDGAPEYAVFVEKGKYGGEYYLEAYDIKNNNLNPIKSQKIYYTNYGKNIGYYNSAQMPYEVYDKYYGSTYNLTTPFVKCASDSHGKLLYDYVNIGSTVFDIDKWCAESTILADAQEAKFISENEILFYDPLIIFNSENDLEITNIKENDNFYSPSEIKWKSQENEGFSKVYIYVDGILTEISEENSAQIGLIKGRHNIELQKVDSNGKVTYARVNINVKKSILPFIIIIILSLAFILAMVIFACAPKIRRNMVLGRRKR